jgi:gliding motility-associated-like protein
MIWIIGVLPVAFYTNVNATPTGPDPFCFPDVGLDVWFSFVAVGTDVSINVIGNTPSNPGGSLNNPQFAIYSGNCGNLTEIQCSSDAFGTNITETFAGPLTVGETYYIQVSARDGNQGTFELCVNNFNGVPEPDSDCPTGVILCDKSPFVVESVQGEGSVSNEVDPSSCIIQEISSSWYKWTCGTAGTLTFTLTPNNPSDDLDFAVYELPNGIEDCDDKELLRCMASGENVGAPPAEWAPCTGPTGLDLASTDLAEFPGCDADDDNFVAALNMEAGVSYALLINNFSNTGSGFAIEFGGSGTFLGPSPDFSIDPPLDNQCDIDQITFTDESFIPAGLTGDITWFFGNGANPASASGPGPHDVIYSSFGNKSIVMQIETDQGCIVTAVDEIFIEPCCDPATALDVSLDDVIDPICAGLPGGFISVLGDGGTPAYQYSIDGENFQPIGQFVNVLAGFYTLYIQDIKGCIDSIPAQLFDPPELLVDAGEDQEIDLGATTSLSAFYSPPGTEVGISWTPPSAVVDCVDCLDPIVLPPGTTTYTIEVIDEVGCRAIDSVTIFVRDVRPIYIPNAFSPNDDGFNDFFTVFGGPAAASIQTLRIFNRWGGMVYEANDIPLNDEQLGWDGRFKGEKMGSGVFAFFAEVAFIDGVVRLYEGDVTLVR